MNKIATHDSATGEKGANLLSWLITPFARTQRKTIAEQYVAGCRSFDLRVRIHKGEWHCAHGLWISRRTALDIIGEIASFADRCQVCVTYEGGMEQNEDFLAFVQYVRHAYAHIIWGYAAVKYGTDSKGFNVKYTHLLEPTKAYEGGERGYLPLDGRSWHTYVPIPWLWDRIYKRPHVFTEQVFTYVDFL